MLHNQTIIVTETPRLIIRYFSENDLESLTAILADPQVMKFSLQGPKSKEETRVFMKKIIADYQSKGYSLYAVIDREKDRLMGFCGLFFWSIEGKEEVEIGYRLDPNYWGRGFATEAAKAVRDYAFKNFDFSSLISLIEPANIASIRVAEKNGMKYEKDYSLHGIPVIIYRIFKQKD